MSSRFSFGLVIAVLCAGCSVDGIDGVFGKGDGDGNSDGGRGSGGGSGGEGGRPTTDVTTSPDNTTSNPQQTNTTGNPDTTTTEAGPTTDSGPSTTTGPDPTHPTVFCNDLPCATGEVCCYYQFQAGFDYCSAPGTCDQGEGWVEHSCNGPDDCEGGECCGFYGQNGWEAISCKPMCSDGDTELCQDAPQACDEGICTPSGALGVGYSRCGN